MVVHSDISVQSHPAIRLFTKGRVIHPLNSGLTLTPLSNYTDVLITDVLKENKNCK